MDSKTIIKNYLDSSLVKVNYIIISKSLLNRFKKENNLTHVKNKIYFDGIELKA